MKQHAPSTERNRDDILGVLRQVLPARGTILEIASGSGQHAVHFAPHFPAALWQPSDRTAESLASIRAWSAEAGVPNLRDPLELDVTAPDWPVESADAIVNINMLHISPWAACEGLMAGAARVLNAGAPLFYYGAFLRQDRETAPSNLAFDRSLRDRDATWGVRQLEDVIALAESCGLTHDRVVDMPNNNYSLVLRRVRV
jgi:hypothetical protein